MPISREQSHSNSKKISQLNLRGRLQRPPVDRLDLLLGLISWQGLKTLVSQLLHETAEIIICAMLDESSVNLQNAPC